MADRRLNQNKTDPEKKMMKRSLLSALFLLGSVLPLSAQTRADWMPEEATSAGSGIDGGERLLVNVTYTPLPKATADLKKYLCDRSEKIRDPQQRHRTGSHFRRDQCRIAGCEKKRIRPDRIPGGDLSYF